LQQYRFTNTYRWLDRTSQYLLLLQEKAPPRAKIHVTLLFKLFNSIDTWANVLREFRDPRDYDPERCANALDSYAHSGRCIFSGAYLIPPIPSLVKPGESKARAYCRLVPLLSDVVNQHTVSHCDISVMYQALREQPGMGDFMAMQLATDLSYGVPEKILDMGEFVVPGPGAIRGAYKLVRKTVSSEGTADLILELFEQQLQLWPRGYATNYPLNLFGIPLYAMDIQNTLCEFDKYCRVARHELSG